MNYNEFMKTVDGKLSTMSEAEKTQWIHNIARTTLCSMKFPALDNDAGEWSELELEELVEEKLVSLDLKQIARNLMYAKYQAAEGKERAVALYRYF